MLLAVVLILMVVLAAAAWLDHRGRRRGSRIRGSDEIGTEIREQERWEQGRRSIGFRTTGDGDGIYSPSRRKRLGR